MKELETFRVNCVRIADGMYQGITNLGHGGASVKIVLEDFNIELLELHSYYITGVVKKSFFGKCLHAYSAEEVEKLPGGTMDYTDHRM